MKVQQKSCTVKWECNKYQSKVYGLRVWIIIRSDRAAPAVVKRMYKNDYIVYCETAFCQLMCCSRPKAANVTFASVSIFLYLSFFPSFVLLSFLYRIRCPGHVVRNGSVAKKTKQQQQKKQSLEGICRNI